MAVLVKDKDQFILDTSQMCLQALIMANNAHYIDEKSMAALARKYAIELWRAMRAPVHPAE